MNWIKLKTILIVVLVWTLVVLLTRFPKHCDYAPSHKIEGFVFLTQPDHITCGPTSATMLLNRYGKQVTIKDVEASTKTKWFKHGDDDFGMTLPNFVAKALDKFGVPAHVEVSNMEKLRWYVDRDYPVIVLLRSGTKTWHYVVVIGYDEGKVFLADPGWGEERTLSASVFATAWSFLGDMNDNPPDVYPDVYADGLRMADVHPYTLIVGSQPCVFENPHKPGG